MKVVGLDGQEYNINYSSYKVGNDTKRRSKLHLAARSLLHELFPAQLIAEEVRLPSTRLFADFILPTQSLVIEVHGQQHYKYNTFHFKDKIAFFKAQARDRTKAEWVRVNGLYLVVLNYNEDIDEWTRKINDRGITEAEGEGAG